MGSPSSKSFKQNLVGISQLTLIKKTPLGKHYRHKLTNQQYLLIQIVTSIESDAAQALLGLNKHLRERVTKSKKNVPKIISFHQGSLGFCSQNSRFQLWMLHPVRSLEEQIREREQMRENFSEGQIWMIIYSSVCGMISYQSLGHWVDLSSSTIFISEKGDVIVSDAYVYSSFRRLRQCKFKKQPRSNILSLCEIVERMTRTLRGRQRYSNHLYSLVAAIRDNCQEGYQKIISLIISYKVDLDQAKRKSSLSQHIEHVVSESAQYYQPQKIESQPCLNEQQMPGKQIHEVLRLSQEGRVKPKFYRTTPIHKCAKSEKFNLNSTDPQLGCQKYWTEVDLSNISEIFKTSQSQQDPRSPLAAINNVFGQLAEDNTRKLELKNKEFLQRLILNEKDMILEVSENSLDVSSARSKLSPSINSSFYSFHMTPASSMGFHE